VDLTRRLRENPDSLWELTSGLARSLHGMRLRYELKQIRSAPERVLQYLRLRDDGTGVYHASGPLKEMATELGLLTKRSIGRWQPWNGKSAYAETVPTCK
jgi:hypothetical protein